MLQSAVFLVSLFTAALLGGSAPPRSSVDPAATSDASGSEAVSGGTTIVIEPAETRDGRYRLDTSVGSAAPPDRLGGDRMTPFGPDPSPLYVDLTSLAGPCSIPGHLTFSTAVNHRRIGSGWVNWSHGYTGDVYYTNSATALTITLPLTTCAFYFYVEPNPFLAYTFTVTADDGTSTTFQADGSAGAAYCGVVGSGIQWLTVASSEDFAIGEFATSCCCGCMTRACCYETAGPAYCIDELEIMACIASGGRWDIDAIYCSDFVPPCGSSTGDLNCDGSVDAFDIDPFVLALTNSDTYAQAYPRCDSALADVNHDGAVNVFDIDPFAMCLVTGRCP